MPALNPTSQGIQGISSESVPSKDLHLKFTASLLQSNSDPGTHVMLQLPRALYVLSMLCDIMIGGGIETESLIV